MKKFLLTLGAVALFAAPSFAQDELADNEQKIDLEFYGDSASDWSVPDLSAPDAKLSTMECTLVQNATDSEGNFHFTLLNAFNSGAPLSFYFNPANEDDDHFLTMHFEETEYVKFNVEADFIDAILNTGTQWTMDTKDGDPVTMNRINFRETNPAPQVQILQDDAFEYEARLYMWADSSSGWLDCHHVVFYFDNMLGESSVAKIEVDNSPVEYYNLQGVKVTNPTNGLYIVRQGKKAHKVMIKK